MELIPVKAADLHVGDWIRFRYGSKLITWYVLEVLADGIKLGTPLWCVEASEIFSYARLDKEGFEYLGHGKKRWWWRFMPCKDIVVPMTGPGTAKRT